MGRCAQIFVFLSPFREPILHGLTTNRMRSIARQSARLASNSSRVRQSSQPRSYPHQAQHARSFSRSTQQAVDRRGPQDPPEHQTSVRQDQETAARSQDESTISGKENDAKSAEKRQPGGISRLGRLKRAKGVSSQPPEPPPMPQWFLQHNVRLQAYEPTPSRKGRNAQVLRCVDNETGHTLFVVPYHEAWPVPSSFPPSSIEKKPKTGFMKKKSVGSKFFDSKFNSIAPPTKDVTDPSTTSSEIRPSDDAQEDTNPHTLLRWPLLEAETALRAGFTASAKLSQTSLLAASRVDLFLRCPDSDSHQKMDEVVEDLANLVQADLIRLDANDFEDLLADYVGQGSDSPGSFSNLAYEVFDNYGSSSGRSNGIIEEDEEDDMDEDEGEEEDEEDHNSGDVNSGFNHRPHHQLDDIRKALFNGGLGALGRVSVTAIPMGPARLQANPSGGSASFRPMEAADTTEWDESRLNAALEGVLNAPREKREKAPTSSILNHGFWDRLQLLTRNRIPKPDAEPKQNLFQDYWRTFRSDLGLWCPDVAGVLSAHVRRASGSHSPPTIKLENTGHIDTASSMPKTGRTIVHVRDLKELCNSRIGEAIVRALVKIVQKRRSTGEEIVIVGTTAQSRTEGIFANFGRNTIEQELFRAISIPPFFSLSEKEITQLKADDLKIDMAHVSTDRRILEINLRHMQSMFERLRPNQTLDLFSERSLSQLHLGGIHLLGSKVFSFDQVQRLILTAIGLAKAHAVSDTLNASHIGLAGLVTSKADQVNRAWSAHKSRKITEAFSSLESKDDGDASSGKDKSRARLDKLRQSCNQHESRLLPGVVDAQNIKTGFSEVHAPAEIVDALKTLTSLSLLRPEAFKYGVLAADRLPGLMLYGPPGTGKTLLAKAVAKESRATVLEISGAQIYEKYVGEGEKMVRAVFSLAKKLSPCIVFIDEADAIFGSRSSAGNRNTHREIINQFLREWDGMDNSSTFIMCATNRPFDVDDAVLRRLPRRLLVDLPVAKDRESILKIHLKDELLDETVDLSGLAENTPLYSGSDLKNLCVSAALACVREENELASGKEDFKLPEKRTLSSRHFNKAIKEISASISEDMSSLTAIRKFDEQYGDRRGRRRKPAYGFGIGSADVDESAVRVRQSAPPP